MATAPRPGVSERAAAEAEAAEMMDSGFTITCHPENKTVTVLFGDLSSDDELACVNEVGMPPKEVLARLSDVTIGVVFYWLGLRQFKDRRPLKKLLKAYGTPRVFFEAFTIQGVGLIDVIEEEDDDEAEVEEEVEAVDPTKPAGPSVTPGPSGPNSSGSTPGTSAAPQS